MSNYNNVNRVLVGDGLNSGAITALPLIKKGDLIVLNEKGNVVATNADALALPKFEKLKIALGVADGKAILSSPIQGNTVSAYNGVAFRAPAEQVDYVGYNGTANTGISITASTDYRLRIVIEDDVRIHGQRTTLQDYVYVGESGSTASDVVDYIACLYGQKEYGQSFFQDKVIVDRISDGTFAALAADATVTKGSKVVTSTGHGLAVGAYVRIGGATFGFGIYKVAEVVDANTFKLDIGYLGASEVVAAANVGGVTGATEFGFKLTGMAQEALISRNENEPFDQYEWIVFNAYFSEADARSTESAALITKATKVDPGNGFWKQVAQQEEDAKGYLGDTSKTRWYDKRINSSVKNGTEYNTLVITHADVHGGDFQGVYSAPLKTEVYIPVGSDQGLNSANNFVNILNGFFNGALGFPEVVY